jgi:toxin ParE1/3/4
MPRVIRTAGARADLIGIWRYIERQSSEDRADRVLRLIDKKCESLASAPQIGRRRDELRPGLRSFAAGRYLILYRPIDGGIEVVRVLHGARNLPALFGS